MDEEVITWNLRGPKRFKKRKELNALIKNNIKYKLVSKYNQMGSSSMINNKSSNTFDMYSLKNQSDSKSRCGSRSSHRLLRNTSSSNSDDDDDIENLYFSANKQYHKE
jgi:hypothetical protein